MGIFIVGMNTHFSSSHHWCSLHFFCFFKSFQQKFKLWIVRQVMNWNKRQVFRCRWQIFFSVISLFVMESGDLKGIQWFINNKKKYRNLPLHCSTLLTLKCNHHMETSRKLMVINNAPCWWLHHKGSSWQANIESGERQKIKLSWIKRAQNTVVWHSVK